MQNVSNNEQWDLWRKETQICLFYVLNETESNSPNTSFHKKTPSGIKFLSKKSHCGTLFYMLGQLRIFIQLILIAIIKNRRYNIHKTSKQTKTNKSAPFLSSCSTSENLT